MKFVRFEVCQMIRHQVEYLIWERVNYIVWDQVVNYCVGDKMIVEPVDDLIYHQLWEPI